MGTIALAAKVTHVPSMFISQLEGPLKGCRRSAIAGLEELGRRVVACGCDTAVLLDTHWLVNSGYHINACDSFQGVFTSNEFPHFIQNLEYQYDGNPALGDSIAELATRKE